MLRRRSDLALERDKLGRFLPWLIAFMVFMAILAGVALLVVSETARQWSGGVSGTLTVQVAPGTDAKDDEERLAGVLSVLAAHGDVARYEVLNDDALLGLLEPWIGANRDLEGLPLPRLIDVTAAPGGLDAAALQTTLRDRIPGVAVDDHRVWLRHLIRLLETIEGIAAGVLALIVLATVGTVVFTTRTGLAIHQDAIEVLHLIGAQDSYIAKQFADRALRHGLKGGLLGLSLAVPALGAMRYFAMRAGDNLIPDVTFGASQIAVALAIPVIVAVIAMWSARSTVIRGLKQMT